MMKRAVDVDPILAPIPGPNPAGEDLRYSPIYDEIKEARRADDTAESEDPKHKAKTSDWDKVIKTTVEALTNKTKDLQIAAWLTEALIKTEGFGGLPTGLRILTGFLTDYWEHVYPQIEDEDLDFRRGPIEFMNDKLWPTVKQVPITDSEVTPGYSWLKWEESRQVGYDADTRNQHGDVDENKKKARDELIGEEKLSAEDFDSAIALSSRSFYESLAEDLTTCKEEFKAFDKILDERFGSNPPRLAEIREALEDCDRVVMKILEEKREEEPAPESEAQTAEGETEMEEGELEMAAPPSLSFSDSGDQEKATWQEALATLKTSGIRKALGQLYGASCRGVSVRERNRYRLLMAKLCLKAKRPDLARPIVEQLHASIEELNLERWESPVWIAEVLDALYQCLTSGEPSDEDMQRARVLFQKLCTIDVTRAMIHKH